MSDGQQREQEVPADQRHIFTTDEPVPGGAPPQPGALEVTVINALDGTPIEGASVTVQSPSETTSGTTDANGQVTFNPLIPDNYNVAASKSGFTTETNSSVKVPQGSGMAGQTPVKTIVQLTPITVTINLPLSVACPGHPFEINAVGTPSGGTFVWSISGGPQLTDSGGVNPVSTGGQVFLVSYQPNNNGGSIPAQNATVTVFYGVRGGSASARQTVPVHSIDFVVTNDTANGGRTSADEAGAKVNLSGTAGVPERSTDPKVQIKLDNSCPRKADCARSYQVGWLQTVLSANMQGRYNDTEVDFIHPVPIRDSADGDALPPFESPQDVRIFSGDGDTQTAHDEDSPSLPLPWADPRPGAPAGSQLFQVFFSRSFTAWLVVQNIEWSRHDMKQSFVFLRNHSWSIHLDVSVDMTKPVGSRCSPQSSPASVPRTMGTGQGGNSPVLTGPTANDSVKPVVKSAPHVP